MQNSPTMALRYDPEWHEVAGPNVAAMAAASKTPRHDVAALRAAITAMVAPIKELPNMPAIEVTEYQVSSDESQSHKIPVYHITPKTPQPTTTPGPAILYIHGGGFIHGSAQDWTTLRSRLVQETSIPIFTVNYRLAPEHPFPAAIEDVYTALTWIHQHADSLRVDRARITIMGESAGGGLAAGVALLARDKHLSPPLAKQILLFPMLDDRNVTPISSALERLATWNTDNNATGWNAYTRQKKVCKDGGDVSPYAAPARASSLERLPPMYVEVGGLDILRDECIAYAGRAAAVGVEVELHVYPGVPHGYESMGVGTSVVNRTLANRYAAMRSV